MQPPKKKKSPWARFGKLLHITVVAAFFLPFFGVSCDGFDIVTVSGADMAMGCEPGGLASEQKNDPDFKDSESDVKIENVKIEPLAIIAIILAIGGVVVAFAAKGRQAVMGSLITSVLCIGAIVALWIKVGGEINDEIATEMKRSMEKSSMMKKAKVESGTRMGLWIALAGLAGCAALAGFALKDPEDQMPDVVPPGGPQGPGSSMIG